MKKFAFNVLSSATLLATAAVPVVATVAPIAASAATNSRVSEVPTFANDADSAQLATLTFKEDSDFKTDLQAGTITLTYPTGAKLNATPVVNLNGVALPAGNVVKTGDYTVTITIPAAGLHGDATTDPTDTLTIDSNVKLDGFSGSTVAVDVQSLGAGVPSGKYTLANVAQGSTVTTALDNVTVGEDGGTLGAIRIEETSVSTIKDGDQVTVKLPNGINWNGAVGDISFLGGLAGNFQVKDTTFDQTDNTLKFKVQKLHDPATRGFIQITPNVKVDKDTAKTGDIKASVSGTNVDTTDVVVGSYSDYQASVKADSTVPQLFSGRYDKNDTTRDEQKLAKLNISEAVKDSILAGRNTTITLPAGVKIIDAEVTNVKGIDGPALQTELKNIIATNEADTTPSEKDQEKFEFEITPNSATTKVDFDLQLYVSVKAGFTGDITANVAGRQGVEGSAVLGKVVSPVTLSATSQKVVIGKKNQAVGDITITEGAAGAILDNKDSDGVLKIYLPDDVSWNSTGKVEVTSGDLTIDASKVDTMDDGGSSNVLTIPVKSESTQASTIKITGATIDINRSVPEGSIVAKVKGQPVVQNNAGDNDKFAEFDASTIASGEVANVATPAPGTTYANASFTIGKTTYTVNGVEKTLDVAPYTKAGRTYLPVRFVAEAVGVSSDSIIWDDATKTVTIIKDGRVAKFTVGKSSYVLNGVTVNMDAAPEFVQNRNMLPLRYVAQALGVQVNWDDATQTVTLQ